MKPNLINERIMLARAHPRNIHGNDLNFSSIYEDQLKARTEKVLPPTSQNTFSAAPPKTTEKPLVHIGTLNASSPTVSNILVNHPEYKQECWQIIHNDVNKEKPYTAIMDGTKIYMDPETKELLWGNMLPQTPPASPSEPIAQQVATRVNDTANYAPATFSEKLVDAVKPYLGQDYNNVNCYELIVNGLEKLGVKYQGSGGLGHKLIQMAIDRGLPINAYFNGEGLIKASGSKVYSKSILSVDKAESQALETIKELEPMLEKGLILSFSTPTKGHTGIISQKDGTWTFINSGDMDNIIDRIPHEKGVGEENLANEILNWFKLAESRKENLRISVGKLNEDQLSAYLTTPGKRVKNV